MDGLVMQYQKLLAAHSQRGIRSAGVVAEFDLVHTGREAFDDRPDLATNQAMFRRSASSATTLSSSSSATAVLSPVLHDNW
jgi:hypothetical protein